MGSNSDCEQWEESFPKKWHFLWFQRNVSLKTAEEEHSRQMNTCKKALRWQRERKEKKEKTLLGQHENGDLAQSYKNDLRQEAGMDCAVSDGNAEQLGTYFLLNSQLQKVLSQM